MYYVYRRPLFEMSQPLIGWPKRVQRVETFADRSPGCVALRPRDFSSLGQFIVMNRITTSSTHSKRPSKSLVPRGGDSKVLYQVETLIADGQFAVLQNEGNEGSPSEVDRGWMD